MFYVFAGRNLCGILFRNSKIKNICEFRAQGNFESVAEFNFAVEQYYKVFCAKKVTFQIAFSNLLKYYHSERKKDLISRNLISQLMSKIAKLNSSKISSFKVHGNEIDVFFWPFPSETVNFLETFRAWDFQIFRFFLQNAVMHYMHYIKQAASEKTGTAWEVNTQYQVYILLFHSSFQVHLTSLVYAVQVQKTLGIRIVWIVRMTGKQ